MNQTFIIKVTLKTCLSPYISHKATPRKENKSWILKY